jgi:murein hydrolase activator
VRRLASLLLPLLLAGASGQVVPVTEGADAAVARARLETADATRRLQALEAAAAKAKSEADRLRAEQAAAAAAIEEIEARIGELDARLRLARTRAALAEQRLAERRAPLSAMLAGLVTMGRQPPLLALADQGSVEEMVRVKALLDVTMPLIERRSAKLKADLAERHRLALAEQDAMLQLARGRSELARRQQRFASMEERAADRASQLAGEAIGASDRVMVSGEALASAGSEATERRAALRNAAAVAVLGMAPARPMRGDSALPPVDFAYSLPVTAQISEGLGSVSRAGIVSRGLRFKTPRGSGVMVPADGEILFAAPFRGQDGLVIIDHHNGWTSLLLNVASDRPRGSKVKRGEQLGRALGPVGVELRRKGVAVSPALIAASSVPLSNGAQNR